MYIGQWHFSPLQSRHLGTSHSSPCHHQLSHCIFLNLINVENLFLSKVILVFEKARNRREPNLGSRGAEPRGWFTVSPKNSAQDMMHEWVLLWWSCQSPVVHSCSLPYHPNSSHRGVLKLNVPVQNLISICCSTYSFRMQWHTVHTLTQWHLLPHWLAQWSHHCLHMCISVHSSWLPGTSITQKPFSVYEQWLDFVWTDLVFV